MRIFAFHLLNDYSGSPKVLMQLAKGWVKEGIDVTLVTCKGREGFLSDIDGVKYRYYWYKWAANPFLRLFNLLLSQKLLILKMLFEVRKTDIIYINTVLPFGAVFLGKIKGCRVIYHVHETTMKPAALKKFLFGLVKWGAEDVIYVSKYLADQEPIQNTKTHILYNAIEDEFLNTALKNRKEFPTDRKNIMMVCSLKDYKGVNEFVELSKLFSNLNFRLVLNASQAEVDNFLSSKKYGTNLEVFSIQTNLHPFYAWADVVLNLSRPDGWVETFGLTIIEAMAYGLPVIVPEVGGITELVEEGGNGFRADSRNLEKVSGALKRITEDSVLYSRMSMEAKKKINQFSEGAFIQSSLHILGF